MKKIVGLFAAAAVLATSVFAADVSANVRIGGNIFSYEAGAAKAKDAPTNKNKDEAAKFSLFSADTQYAWYQAPIASLATSTDEAGAQVLLVGDGDNVKFDRAFVWFKPLDMLKIQLGQQDFAMNKESIDWTEQHGEQAFGEWGYGISYAQDAISINLGLGTGKGGYFFKDAIAAYETDAEPLAAYIKDLFVNFAYGADFGTIGAFFRYQGKHWDISKAAATKTWVKNTTTDKWEEVEVKAASTTANFTPDVISFGASYKNTIDALTFFVNVVGKNTAAASDKELLGASNTLATDKDGKNGRSMFGLGVDAFVQYSADALTVKGFVKYDTADFGHLTKKDGKLEEDIMADNNTIIEVLARLDYKLDNGIGLYAYFKDANLLNKQTKAGDKDPSSVFASTIKLGATGSVGIASWETWFQIDTGLNGAKGKYDKVNLSMPFYVKVGF